MSDIFDADDFVNNDEDVLVYQNNPHPFNIFPKGIATMPAENAQPTANLETLLDLETVEGLSFDDLEEAPGFVTPPDGNYILRVESGKAEKYKTKDTAEKKGEERSRFSNYYIIEKVLELANPADQAPAIGSKFSERFMHNDNGLKYWKSKVVSILGDAVKGGNLTVANVLKELSSGTYYIKAKIQNKKTTNKVDKKEYTNTQVRVIQRMTQPDLDAAGLLNPDPDKAI